MVPPSLLMEETWPLPGKHLVCLSQGTRGHPQTLTLPSEEEELLQCLQRGLKGEMTLGFHRASLLILIAWKGAALAFLSLFFFSSLGQGQLREKGEEAEDISGASSESTE